jgi:hypothetical protein
VDAADAELDAIVENTRREAGITTKAAYRREWHAERAG